MKIAIVTPFYKPSIGGVEYIAYHTARELLKQGFEVHVITTTHDNRWRRIASPGTSVEERIYVHRLEPSCLKVGYATIMRGLKEVLAGIKPDIVHCHNLHPHLFQSMKWKDELRYRLVAQLHFPVATGIDHLPAKLLFQLVMRSLVKSQHRLDAFIAHTYMEKRWLVNEGIEESRIHVVRFPGVPDELLEYRPKSDIHEKLSTSTVITYIARIHPRKGQHLLIEAVGRLRRELKDFKVYVAGPLSDEKYLKKLYMLIDRLDLRKHVVIDPRSLSECEKLDAIVTSDVFACTPIKDIHPITILEALALRTPIVATKVGAIPEMLNAGTIIEEYAKGVESDKLRVPVRMSLEGEFKDIHKIIAIVGINPEEIARSVAGRCQLKHKVDPSLFVKVVTPYTTSRIATRLTQLYNSLLP